MPGAGPFGLFDPLGFTKGGTEATVRYYREVELKHGRVAMLCAATFIFSELSGAERGVMPLQQLE